MCSPSHANDLWPFVLHLQPLTTYTTAGASGSHSLCSEQQQRKPLSLEGCAGCPRSVSRCLLGSAPPPLYWAEGTLLQTALQGTALGPPHQPPRPCPTLQAHPHCRSCENLCIFCLLWKVPFFLFFPQTCQPDQRLHEETCPSPPVSQLCPPLLWTSLSGPYLLSVVYLQPQSPTEDGEALGGHPLGKQGWQTSHAAAVPGGAQGRHC